MRSGLRRSVAIDFNVDSRYPLGGALGDAWGTMADDVTATTREHVRRRIIALLEEIARIPPEAVTDEATIEEDLRLESVAFVELQVALEDEYGVELNPVRIVELNRFGDIVAYVADVVATAR